MERVPRAALFARESRKGEGLGGRRLKMAEATAYRGAPGRVLGRFLGERWEALDGSRCPEGCRGRALGAPLRCPARFKEGPL